MSWPEGIPHPISSHSLRFAHSTKTSPEIAILMERSAALGLRRDTSHIALVGPAGVSTSKDWSNGTFAELGHGTPGIDGPGILTRLTARQFGGWVLLEQSQSEISPLESARINTAYLRDIGHDVGLRADTMLTGGEWRGHPLQFRKTSRRPHFVALFS